MIFKSGETMTYCSTLNDQIGQILHPSKAGLLQAHRGVRGTNRAAQEWS